MQAYQHSPCWIRSLHLVQDGSGAPWRDLPERYGPWKTAHERLRKWTMDGTWDKILEATVVKDDTVWAVEWIVSVDSTVVRAHQHSAGAWKKRGAAHRQSKRSPAGENASDAPAED
ncbi:transposase [Rhodococcus pyridinivorans]|uniref:transposase n=1 Tax=Rhodococcus pyridinivorans TaxID=103816 RepID=UPI003D7F68AA